MKWVLKNQCQGFSDVIQRFDNLTLSDIAWFPFESECKVIFFFFYWYEYCNNVNVMHQVVLGLEM